MIENNEVICPTCKAAVAMRINRNGFWQKSVLARFGIYPWKCGACGSMFMVRRRGHRPRQSGQGTGTGTDRARPVAKHRQA